MCPPRFWLTCIWDGSGESEADARKFIQQTSSTEQEFSQELAAILFKLEM